jgi:SAM-dependent methyltransferase
MAVRAGLGPSLLPRGVTLTEMRQADEHWDAVYTAKGVEDLSWFQQEPVRSRRLLGEWAPPGGGIVDVGAGTSMLVDFLIDAGYPDVTVLDVSAAALDVVRARLGPRACQVSFVVADIRSWKPGRTFGAWHDRAVFHFLVDSDDRRRYVNLAASAVAPGGVAVLATFADDGPTACSGLPTARYDADRLARLFSPSFALVDQDREEHVTPWGTVQPFTWVVLRRVTS